MNQEMYVLFGFVIIVGGLTSLIWSFANLGYNDSSWPLWASIIVPISLMATLVTSCNSSETVKAQRAASAAQDRLDAVPRLISEADGCKVYAFKGGDRWRYFTRCPNARVTTDNDYTVRSGKTTRTEQEEIETNSDR